MEHQIIQGDCREVLTSLPAELCDLVWFSPPYGDLHKYSTDSREIGQSDRETYIQDLTDVGVKALPLLKSTGNLAINIMDRVEGNRPVPYSAYVIEAFTRAGYQWVESIVWHIPNKMPVTSNRRFVNKMEWVIHFAKTPEYYFDKDSVRQEHSKYALTDKRTWKWNAKGKCPGNVWDIPAYRVSGQHKKHIAAFPAELSYRVIQAWCPPNGLVLDPFTGSGTTNATAAQLGRSSIGIELDKGYAAAALLRLQNLDQERKRPG